jgi:hypothetical protein
MSEIIGSTSWGHTTGTQEGNVRTFSGNWTGTGFVTSSGDSEKILLSSQAYMESEIVNTGANSIQLLQNKYSGGDTGILKYRSGSNVVNCQAAGWQTYSGSFASLGYTQLRIEQAWWLTEGVSNGDTIAAYQAKGAGGYSNSLNNLVEDACNLTAPSGAPDWDNTYGWKYQGGDTLYANIVENVTGFTGILMFSNCSDISQTKACLIGGCYISPSTDTGEGGPYVVGFGNSPFSLCNSSPSMASGVIAVTYNTVTDLVIGYRNDDFENQVSEIEADLIYPPDFSLTIGGPDIYVQTFSVYRKVLTSTQIAKIISKMVSL